jgi:hypothetical protein
MTPTSDLVYVSTKNITSKGTTRKLTPKFIGPYMNHQDSSGREGIELVTAALSPTAGVIDELETAGWGCKDGWV